MATKKADRQKRFNENHNVQIKLTIGEVVSWPEDDKEEDGKCGYGVVYAMWGKEYVIVQSILHPSQSQLRRHLQQIECAEVTRVDLTEECRLLRSLTLLLQHYE
jgi:hypothetical protein